MTAGGAIPRTVKVLIPLWGREYVLSFLARGLPSLAAPGNLPALADAFDTTLVLLTREKDRAFLEGSEVFRCCTRSCRVTFITIDELVVGRGLYGYTISLAYERGIAAFNDDAHETAFVFLVCDYVLADGSLRSVAEKFRGGERVLVSISLRVTEESGVGALAAPRFHQGAALVIPPRDGVALALRHAHPSLWSKIRNGPGPWSPSVQHFYWQTEGGLVGRYFSAHVLGLWPSRASAAVEGFCDYAYVDTFCPGAGITFMADSDDYLALEFQSRSHELALRRRARTGVGEIASSLATWATATHRRISRQPFLFHAGAVDGPGFAAALTESDRFIGALLAALPATPVPSRDHPHWTARIAEFHRAAASRKAHGALDVPVARALDTAVSTEAAAPGRLRQLRRLARQLVVPRAPSLPFWHSRFRDYRAAKALVARLRRVCARPLLVLRDDHPLRRWKGLAGLACLSPADFLEYDGAVASQLPQGHDGVILCLGESACDDIDSYLAIAARLLPRGGPLALWVLFESVERPDPVPAIRAALARRGDLRDSMAVMRRHAASWDEEEAAMLRLTGSISGICRFMARLGRAYGANLLSRVIPSSGPEVGISSFLASLYLSPDVAQPVEIKPSDIA